MKNKLSSYMKTLQELKPILERDFNVSELSVFGSFVRGDQTPQSDLDILVTYSVLPDLFKFVELMQYLEDKLEIKIDLVLKDDLKPRIAKHILAEKIDIY
jgi:predicted nucleotidyltransferase